MEVEPTIATAVREEGRDIRPDVFQEAIEAKRMFSHEEEYRTRARALDEREKKLKAARMQLETEVRELEDWAKELEERETSLEGMESKRGEFEAEKEKWESDRDSILNEFRKIEEGLIAREEEAGDRKKRLDEVEDRLAKAMNVAEEVQTRSTDIRNIQRGLEAKEAKVASLEKELEDRKNNLESRVEEVREKEAKVGEYLEALNLQEEEILSLREKLGELENEHTSLRDRHERIKKEASEAERIKSALRTAEAERENLKKKLDEHDPKVDGQTVNSLKDRIHKLEEKITKQRAEDKRRLEDLVRLERAIREKDEKLKKVTGHPDNIDQKEETTTIQATASHIAPSDHPVKEAARSVPQAEPRIVDVPPEAEIWFQKGKALMKKGNHRPAVLCFDHALENSPENPEILLQKARALYASNGYVQASKVLENLSNVLVDDPDVWELKGLTLYKLHREAEALEAFKKTVELEKKPSSLKLAGRLLQKRGETAESLSYIEEALRIDPNDVQAWKIKSSILTSLGRHEEAGEALRNSRAN